MTGPSPRPASCCALVILWLPMFCTVLQAQPQSPLQVPLESPPQPKVHSADVPVEKVFAAVPFEKWVRQGARAPLPWKVHVPYYALSLHQRLRARMELELAGKDVLKLPAGDRLLLLLQVSDAAGHVFRDYNFFLRKELPPQLKKLKVVMSSDFFVLPGEYKITLVLFDYTS